MNLEWHTLELDLCLLKVIHHERQLTTRMVILSVAYHGRNGQKIGTNQITITNTAMVRIEPTLRKSKKRYRPGV